MRRANCQRVLDLDAGAVYEHRHVAQLGFVAAQPVPCHARADVAHAGVRARQRQGAHARQVLAQMAAVGHPLGTRDPLRHPIAPQAVDIVEMAAPRIEGTTQRPQYLVVSARRALAGSTSILSIHRLTLSRPDGLPAADTGSSGACRRTGAPWTSSESIRLSSLAAPKLLLRLGCGTSGRSSRGCAGELSRFASSPTRR